MNSSAEDGNSARPVRIDCPDAHARSGQLQGAARVREAPHPLSGHPLPPHAPAGMRHQLGVPVTIRAARRASPTPRPPRWHDQHSDRRRRAAAAPRPTAVVPPSPPTSGPPTQARKRTPQLLNRLVQYQVHQWVPALQDAPHCGGPFSQTEKKRGKSGAAAAPTPPPPKESQCEPSRTLHLSPPPAAAPSCLPTPPCAPCGHPPGTTTRDEKPTLAPPRQLHNNWMVHVLRQVQGVGAGATAAVTTAATAGVAAPWSAL